MRCKYCFYEDESEHRMAKSMGLMSIETADRLIEQVFACAQPQDQVTFAFQGGEPTLVGKEFYRHFLQTVQAKNQKGVPVQYAIQTNGYGIDDEWVDLLKQGNFLVGVSVDGEKTIHDTHRVDAAGKGTWNKVTKAVQKLLAAQVPVNLLCVVTKACARSPQKVYRSLKKLGTPYIQTIACLDPMEQPRGSMPYSLLPQDYGTFLCGLFDLWYQDLKQGNYVSIRLFEDLVHLALGLPPSTCASAGCCGAYYVIEGDGSVYPCDFFVLDEWYMGNLHTHSLEQLSSSPAAQKFLQEGLQKPQECQNCPFRALCHGGCKRDWVQTEDGVHNYYCASFRMLFAHAGSRIAEIAQDVSRRAH